MQGDRRGGLGRLDQNVSCPRELWKRCKLGVGCPALRSFSTPTTALVLIRLCFLGWGRRRNSLGGKRPSKAVLKANTQNDKKGICLPCPCKEVCPGAVMCPLFVPCEPVSSGDDSWALSITAGRLAGCSEAGCSEAVKQGPLSRNLPQDISTAPLRLPHSVSPLLPTG